MGKQRKKKGEKKKRKKKAAWQTSLVGVTSMLTVGTVTVATVTVATVVTVVMVVMVVMVVTMLVTVVGVPKLVILGFGIYLTGRTGLLMIFYLKRWRTYTKVLPLWQNRLSTSSSY